MMKALPQDAFVASAKAKCGEIFCQSSTSFSIICTFCEMKIFKFSDFLLHFKNVHFDNNLLKTNELNMPTTVEPSATTSTESLTLKQECFEEQPNMMMTTTDVFGAFNDTNDWFHNKDNYDFNDEEDDDDPDAAFNNGDNCNSSDHADNKDNESLVKHKASTVNNASVSMTTNSSNRVINWSGKTTKTETPTRKIVTHNTSTAMSTRLKRGKQSNLKNTSNNTIKDEINSETEVVAKNIEEENEMSDKQDKTFEPTSPPRQTSRDYKCEYCDKIYVSKGSLVMHMRREHNVSSITTCGECKKDLPSQRTHDQHVIQEHGGFLCGQCTKRYKCRRDLKRHEIKHSGVRSIVCDFEGCDKRFFTIRNMQSHRKIHTLEKNFVCENCGYSCRTKYTLRIHLRMHTGEKPFACKVCSKRFPSHSGLREHITMHSTARPHICLICNAAFARQKALYHHKFLHSETKKFVCKICGNAYAQQAGLAGHMRKHKIGIF